VSDQRQKNKSWSVADKNGKVTDWAQAQVAVLMDIRDELQAINSKLSCYRIPRALDAMHELGVEARRKKRDAAKKRKATRSSRNVR